VGPVYVVADTIAGVIGHLATKAKLWDELATEITMKVETESHEQDMLTGQPVEVGVRQSHEPTGLDWKKICRI